MQTDDIAQWSATRLLECFESGELSPVEATRAALRRIAACNADVAALCLVDEDRALASARESEARWFAGEPCGRLDGVPTTIKDLVLARGWPTRRGSLAVPADGNWSDDAPATARLREQGAVLLGKTCTSEFGWKCVTDSLLSGVTRNPWDLTRTPGGSSGGAAVAAALGMGALHLGTDGGGSIRIPAGFTGVFGMKPSFGRVPHYPPAHTGSLLHVGMLTRTVADAALMMSVVSAPDPRDPGALPPDGRSYLAALDHGLAGTRIGYSRTLGLASPEPEVASLVERSIALFTDLGACVEPVDLTLGEATETFEVLWHAGAYHLVQGFDDAQRALVEPGLRAIAARGATIALDTYLDALDARVRLGIKMRRFHERFDLLVTPTLPITAFAAGRLVPDPATQSAWTDWAPYCFPFNLTQQPACSVPCGLTPQGLPVGLQIIGRPHDDRGVLRAAHALEQAQPFHLPPLPRR